MLSNPSTVILKQQLEQRLKYTLNLYPGWADSEDRDAEVLIGSQEK